MFKPIYIKFGAKKKLQEEKINLLDSFSWFDFERFNSF